MKSTWKVLTEVFSSRPLEERRNKTMLKQGTRFRVSCVCGSSSPMPFAPQTRAVLNLERYLNHHENCNVD